MKPIVVRSIEDASGQRCVDVRLEPDQLYSWVECRRDPEDDHGWRRLNLGADGFSSEDTAFDDAVAQVGWMRTKT